MCEVTPAGHETSRLVSGEVWEDILLEPNTDWNGFRHSTGAVCTSTRCEVQPRTVADVGRSASTSSKHVRTDNPASADSSHRTAHKRIRNLKCSHSLFPARSRRSDISTTSGAERAQLSNCTANVNDYENCGFPRNCRVSKSAK
jgi:hypothetical protein